MNFLQETKILNSALSDYHSTVMNSTSEWDYDENLNPWINHIKDVETKVDLIVKLQSELKDNNFHLHLNVSMLNSSSDYDYELSKQSITLKDFTISEKLPAFLHHKSDFAWDELDKKLDVFKDVTIYKHDDKCSSIVYDLKKEVKQLIGKYVRQYIKNQQDWFFDCVASSVFHQ